MTPDDGWQAWLEQIYASGDAKVSAILDTGRRLLMMKDGLPYGEWQAECKVMGFSRQTAFRLMRIAQHHVISDVTHVQHLPPHWGTLYELTKIPSDELEDLLESGLITPEMQRADVVALRHYDWPQQPDDLSIHTPPTWVEPAQMDPASLVFLSAPIARKLAVGWVSCKGDESQWLDAAGIMPRSQPRALALCTALRMHGICRAGGITDDLALRYITTIAAEPMLKIRRRNDQSRK